MSDGLIVDDLTQVEEVAVGSERVSAATGHVALAKVPGHVPQVLGNAVGFASRSLVFVGGSE
jgi:hypothetical protein